MKYQLRATWLVALLCALGIMLSACGGPYEWKGGAVNPPATAPDFTLTTSDGQPWTLSQQRGKVVALFFGYTYCPDVCPTTLSDLSKVSKQLGGDADNFEVAFVTVDPERDTPERMQKYVKGFNTAFVGLTGKQEELQKVYKAYGVYVEKQDMPNSALKYTVNHTGLIYTVDPAGKMKVLFRPDMTVDDMVSDTRQLFAQGAA
jgi:protein SCO1/2